MPGIKETSDLVRVLGAAVTVVEKARADGIGLDDVSLLLEDDFVARVSAAFDGITEVPSELTDLSWTEIITLVRQVAGQLA